MKVLVIGLEQNTVEDGLLNTINYLDTDEFGNITGEPKQKYTKVNCNHVIAGELYNLFLAPAKTTGKDKIVGIVKA